MQITQTRGRAAHLSGPSWPSGCWPSPPGIHHSPGLSPFLALVPFSRSFFPSPPSPSPPPSRLLSFPLILSLSLSLPFSPRLSSIYQSIFSLHLFFLSFIFFFFSFPFSLLFLFIYLLLLYNKLYYPQAIFTSKIKFTLFFPFLSYHSLNCFERRISFCLFFLPSWVNSTVCWPHDLFILKKNYWSQVE